jgi:hypothetical protein
MKSANRTNQPARATYLEVSPYESDGGSLIGRHPRALSSDDLMELSAQHTPLRAIRAKCVDCSGGSVAEVRKCTAVFCELWPFRMGFGPYHARSSATKTSGA